MTDRIVVGVDGSDHGNAALHWAVQEACVHDATLVAVFAWQMPFLDIPGAFEHEEIEQVSKDFLVQTVADQIPDCPLKVETLVARGDVSEVLIEASKNADLLVLGSRGRGGFAGLKLGSVSSECTAHAACPVAIIKPTKAQIHDLDQRRA